uniref:LysM peptidoglycan-binding domain-containing protein n=1 Tax=Pullulanibacillus pueri TaxID=1437324 RepID=UPI00227C80D2|nr:LysM domain-containing protein [Pullulanibacillus pueri]
MKSNVANPPTPKAAPKASSQYYTVKKGDTFYIISKKYGITLNQIKVLNPKVTNFNRLSVGQRIRVAANIHTVKSGETAWVIAKKYGMTSSELANLNPQDSNLATLTVGQKLYVR